MFYFKKVHITDLSKTEVENLFRKASLKRTSSLDLTSATSDAGSDKLFLGYTGKSALLFTRLHTSLENFLPKVIIKLPLDTDECYYQLRLKGLTAFIAIGLTLVFILALFQTSIGEASIDALPLMLLISIIYVGLVLLEIKFTINRINKALSRPIVTTPSQPD